MGRSGRRVAGSGGGGGGGVDRLQAHLGAPEGGFGLDQFGGGLLAFGGGTAGCPAEFGDTGLRRLRPVRGAMMLANCVDCKWIIASTGRTPVSR